MAGARLLASSAVAAIVHLEAPGWSCTSQHKGTESGSVNTGSRLIEAAQKHLHLQPSDGVSRIT